MKVFNQSTLAEGSPYLHLGYVAATRLVPDGRWVHSGWELLAAGFLMVACWLIGRRAGVRTEQARSRTWRWALLGMLGFTVMGLGTLSIMWGFARSQDVPVYPEMFTQIRAESILYDLEARRQQNQELPADIESVRKLSGQDWTKDGWKRDMRLEHAAKDGRTFYTVISAGPDATFGTADDLRYPEKPNEAPATPSPAPVPQH